MIRHLWIDQFLSSTLEKTALRSTHARRIRRVFHDLSAIQHLEVRTLLSAVTWTGLGDGSNWNDPANWSGGTVPTSVDDVTLTASLSIPTGMTITFRTLNLGSSDLTLTGGRISGGSIEETGTGRFMVSGSAGALNGVTLNGSLSIVAGADEVQGLYIENNLILNGTVTLGRNARMFFNGTQSLAGNGTVLFTDSPGSLIAPIGDHTTITIESGITIRGGSRFSDGARISQFTGIDATVILKGNLVADVPGTGIRLNLAGSDAFQNQGLIKLDGGDLWLGGSYTHAGLGRIDRRSGMIYLSGSLDNRDATLYLDSPQTSWTLHGGRIQGGRVVESGGGRLLTSGSGELDGISFTGDLTVPQLNTLLIRNGLTLQGTITVQEIANLYFLETQSLSGSGTIILSHRDLSGLVTGTHGMTLTIDTGITVRGSGTIGWSPRFGGGENVSLELLGKVVADVAFGAIRLDPNGFGTVRINGELAALDGGLILLRGTTVFSESSTLTQSGDGTIGLFRGFSSEMISPSQFKVSGIVTFDGTGTAGNPNLLEVMSVDRGLTPAGFQNNFGFGMLSLNGAEYVKLVDEVDNSYGNGPEALYANSIFVPAGTTLDLNGFNVYVRSLLLEGQVINGTIQQMLDSGELTVGTPTPGIISTSGERDEWTFFSRADRDLTIEINFGTGGVNPALQPSLDWGTVTVFDPNGQILATDSSSGGGVIRFRHLQTPLEGNYRVQIQASNGHVFETGNYVLSVYDSTTNRRSLLLNEPVFGGLTTPYEEDRWEFTADSVTSLKFDLRNSSTPGISFTLIGPNNSVVIPETTGDYPLVTLPFAGSYTLVAHHLTGGTGSYSFSLDQTTQKILPFNGSLNDSLAGTGQALLYKVSVPSTQVLSLLLNDLSTTGRAEMYARFGSPPTRSVYDYRFASPGSSHSILIPSAAAGDWYVLVYGEYVPQSRNFTLVSAGTPSKLISITPESIGNSEPVTLTLTGAGFLAGTTVELISADGLSSYAPSTFSIDSYSQITATFPSNLPIGAYSVQINSFGNSSMLVAALNITGAGEGKFESEIILPSAIGLNTTATMYLNYRNTGTTAIKAPLLSLESPDITLPRLTLDSASLIPGFWTNAEKPVEFSRRLFVIASGKTPGILQPGESVQIPVYLSGLGVAPSLTVRFNLSVVDETDTSPIDWNALKQDLKPDWISTEAWNPIFQNLLNEVGGTSGDYIRFLNEIDSYLGRLGDSAQDVAQKWGFAIQQANGMNPVSTLAASVDASLPASGLALSFGRSFGETINNRYQMGAFGRGWSVPWQTSLSVKSDGTVVITTDGGNQFVYQKDSRTANSYFGAKGDMNMLMSGSMGMYMWTQTDGTVTAFRADGKLSYVQDTNGNRITAGYNGSGRLATLTHSSGQSLTIAYNGAGLISSVTDSTGRQSVYSYDAANQHLLSVQNPAGTTRYTYSIGNGAATEHALTSVEYPDGTHRYFTYNSEGHLASTSRDGNNERLNYTYDQGKVTATDLLGNSTSTYFNHLGLLRRTVDALGNSTYFQYDPKSLQVSRIIDPTGLTQSFSYDTHGDIASSTDALGQTTFYTHGTYSRLTSLTDAKGNKTVYTYDPQGNLLNTTYDNGSRESATFDPLGNPLSFTNRRGQAVTYSYNAAGQVTRQTFPDASHTDFVYDLHGNLATATDAAGTTTLTYDAADRLTRIDYPDGMFLQFTLDAGGRRTRMEDQTGFSVNYFYDNVGRLAGLRDETNASIVVYTYDVAGRLSRKENANGTYTTYEYDRNGNVLHLINYAPGGSINSRFDYTYDLLGRRMTMGTLEGDWTYTYDATGQLTHAVFDSFNTAVIADQDLFYNYDALGNRTSTVINGVTTVYTSNNLNQYVTVGGVPHQYDADGNLINDGTNTYAYDVLSRLVSVTGPEGTSSYTYDALGNRSSKTVNGQLTRFLNDPTGLVDVVGEFDATGNILAQNTYGQGLISRTTGAQRYFFEFDAIGNTSSLTSSVGILVNRYSYLPFGTSLVSVSSVFNPYQFVGQLGVSKYSTGLFFMRARAYSPLTGVFNTVDPLRIRQPTLYSYANNNPVLEVDPSGLAPQIGSCDNPYNDPIDFLKQLNEVRKILKGAYGPLRIYLFILELLEPIFEQAQDFGQRYGHQIDPYQQMLNPQYGGNPATPGPTYMPPNCSPGLKPPVIPPDPGPGKPIGRWVVPIAFGMDPNDKFCPVGFGTENFVQGDDPIPYRIRFENYGPGSKDRDGNPVDSFRWATAPAHVVTISDFLSPDLDWDTFRLSEIGFGDLLLTIPPNSTHYQTTYPMTYNGKTFNVLIEAGIRIATGEVFIIFQSIDPNTELPPDVLTGFLPPEDETGRGMGHFSYSVKPRAGLPSGTPIRNIALISFDGQTAIATDQIDPLDPSQGIDPSRQALITIDAGGPTSAINPLPATTNNPAIPLNWSGTDDANGSGIAFYDLYVSEDNGPFSLFLSQLTQASATFNGVSGKSYRFFSIATDNVGHRQTAQTIRSIQVVGNSAPVLNTAGNPTFDPIPVNVSNSSNPGTLVSTLIARMSPLGGITDPDPGALRGIAVVALTGTNNGTWQFTLNNGTTWADIAATGTINARLLAADSNTRIRFVPNSGFTGTEKIAFVAWDRTEGTNGQLINAGNRGGSRPYSSDWGYASITVNTAPVLNTAGSPTFDPITVNIPNANNLGTLVSTLIARMSPLGGMSDIGTGTLRGIAVNGLTGTTTGTWQYSLNNGAGWANMSVTGNFDARLLAADDKTRVRYVPNTNFTGEAKIAFVAWDQSSGINGGTAVVASRGGTTPFSLAYEYVSIIVNSAPVLNTAGSPTLDSITVNIPNANNVGTLVSTLIARMSPLGGITDAGAGVLKGIAINGLTGTTTGTWQYSLNNGAGWANMSVTGNFDARLLAADDKTRIRYVPNANFSGEAKFAFVAWDRSSGINGGTAVVASRGGTTPFSLAYEYASITVNTAPVLNNSGSPSFDSISTNLPAVNNPGTLVSTLISRMAPLGGITDVGTGVLKGVAINGLSGTATGTWQYSLNNGSSWANILTTGNANALLLAADQSTRIRYLSNNNFSGEVKIAFVAWDRSSGVNGGTANVASRGGTTPYSLDYEYASLIVNTAPVLGNLGDPLLNPIPMNVSNPNNPGTLVTDIITRMAPAGGVADSDAGAVNGIAINGLSNTANGTWQYTINGGTTWSNIGTTGNSDARLLAANSSTRIRYVPNTGFSGVVKIVFVAWDQTSGVNGGVANVGARGGSTAFSLDYEYASLTIV